MSTLLFLALLYTINCARCTLSSLLASAKVLWLKVEDVNATYSEPDAFRVLNFAYGAYCNQSSLESWTCKWCENVPDFKPAKVVTNDYLQAFVGLDNDQEQIVIAFRGTHNYEDWIDDLDALQTAYPGIDGGYVHSGFYESWVKELQSSIMPATQSLIDDYPTFPVLITGHSMGGALAQLCALDVAAYAPDKSISLYTYGAPRWGNSVMVQHFEQAIEYHFRIVNKHDVVPTVPYTEMGDYDKYHHTWTQIWYTSDAPLTHVECDGSGEDENCYYYGDSMEDHLNYLGVREGCT